MIKATDANIIIATISTSVTISDTGLDSIVIPMPPGVA